MGAWIGLINRDYGTDLTMRDITQWDIHSIPKLKELGNKIYDYLHHSDLYDYVLPVPGGMEGVKELRAAGHRVVFTTTCVKGMTDPKWNWLEKHGFLPTDGPRFNQKDLVVLADKNLIDADILIDDKPAAIDKWVSNKKRAAIWFQSAYEHELDHKHSAFWLWCFKTKHWPEVVSHIEAVNRGPYRGVLNDY